MKLICPHCGASYSGLAASRGGAKLHCRVCDKSFTTPPSGVESFIGILAEDEGWESRTVGPLAYSILQDANPEATGFFRDPEKSGPGRDSEDDSEGLVLLADVVEPLDDVEEADEDVPVLADLSAEITSEISPEEAKEPAPQTGPEGVDLDALAKLESMSEPDRASHHYFEGEPDFLVDPESNQEPVLFAGTEQDEIGQDSEPASALKPGDLIGDALKDAVLKEARTGGRSRTSPDKDESSAEESADADDQTPPDIFKDPEEPVLYADPEDLELFAESQAEDYISDSAEAALADTWPQLPSPEEEAPAESPEPVWEGPPLDGESVLRGVLESLEAPLLACDKNGIIFMVNLAMLKLLGLPGEAGEYLGWDVSALFGVKEVLQGFVRRCLKDQTVVQGVELRLGGPKGSRTVKLDVRPVFIPQDNFYGAVVMLVDVTDVKQREQDRLAKRTAIRRMTAQPKDEPSPIMVMSTDQQGRITSKGAMVDDVLERLGIELDELLPPNHGALVAQVLAENRSLEGVTHEIGARTFSWTYNPLQEHDLVQVLAREILDKRNKDEEGYDPLTGLPDKKLFMMRLGLALERAEKEGGRFFVLLCELDRFRRVNDSLGHAMGDELILEFSSRALAELRPGDTMASFGQGEFAVLLDSVDDPDVALQAADRLIKLGAKSYGNGDMDLYVTLSIGIAAHSPGRDDPENVLRDADAALAKAKQQGGDQSCLFEESFRADTRDRLMLEMDLKRDVSGHEITVYYQPIVSLKTGYIVGFEALTRWFHPQRGLLGPEEFIPLAEESGIIVELGTKVLSQALRWAVDCRETVENAPDLMMSVNLSVRQFASPSLLDDVNQALVLSQFPANRLKLEVTESGIMDNPDQSLRLLKQLRSMGVRMSIDDFGTGYSSLSQLHRFPFDFLKVDKSFVTAMEEEGEKLEIVRTVISLAHCMQKQVVAEGVETAAQLGRLRRLGCEYAQGYLFSRPVSGEEAMELVEMNPKW